MRRAAHGPQSALSGSHASLPARQAVGKALRSRREPIVGAYQLPGLDPGKRLPLDGGPIIRSNQRPGPRLASALRSWQYSPERLHPGLP
jgi:hypothetical protein